MPAKARGRGGRGGRGGRRQIPARSTVSTDTTSGAAHNTAGAGVSSAEGGSGSIAALAKAHWAGRAGKWSVDVVRAILAQHIVGAKFARAGLQALERAQYLEQYLWRHYPDDGSGPAEVVVSVLLMVNEKLQQRLQASAWAVVASDAARFARLFDDAVDLMNHVMAGTEFGFIDGMSVRSIVAQFLIGCFGSLETRAVRDCVMPLVSVAIWHHVDGAAERERALAGVPQLRKFWKHANKRCRGDGAEAVRHRRDRDFLPALVRDFVRCQFAPGGSTGGAMAYGAKVLELLADLESQLATRRYVHLLLADMQVVSLCERSPWIRLAGDDAQALLGRRFRELVGRLRTAADAQVRDVTGGALTDGEARDAHYQKLADLQLTAFEHFPRELEALAVSSVARLGDSEVLAACLAVLDRPALLRLSEAVGIRHRALVLTAAAPDLVEADGSYASDFVVAAFGERYRQRPTAAEQARTASPYPTEQLLYSAAVDEADGYERQAHAVTYSTSGDSSEATSVCYPVLAVPKLNLQFLTVHDYLARSFELLQLESAHEIREDVEDAVRRLQPRATYEDAASGGDRMATSANTHFAGWARMAVPLRSLEVSDVQRPRLGEAAPARVRADISVDLGDHAESIRREWDEELRPRDVLILCAAGPAEDGPAQRAVRAVRGCEIECRLDAAGRPIGVDPDNGEARDGATTAGSVRRFRVLLDRQQYHADVKADSDLYAALNVVVRRRPQESNFKAVLETIRDLMASPPALPGWLAATFLGYGDPAAAAEEAQWTRAGRVWLGDTFVSEDHVRECLAPLRVEFPDGAFATPCIVEFPADADAAADGGGVVRVTQAAVLSMGPAELAPRRTNQIRFTAAQVAAIGSAAREGLTLIVGPPGTGKTDVAVQIVANLYHAHPRQKILLITHSNQALNQLFEKIIALDIEPRHLLRLGHGEGALDAEERYSRAGRVDSFLERRAELLADVRALAESLGVTGDDAGYTCDNARFFHVVHVRMRWDAFRRAVLDADPAAGPPAADAVRAGFPFTRFFEARLGGPLFADGASGAALAETAAGCFRWLERLFDELADIQPFELLRTRADRANYLLTNQARIVAMTCTHAALKRADLVRLGFRYDTVVMEEAAQVLDVESLIPLTLRRPVTAAGADAAAARELKRLVLIGDHNQLPPVVRSGGLRAFANMDQSLFARLVRLGVPYVELNRQARARPSIADLYRFRYCDLGDLLPTVAHGAFARPNAALAHDFQFVDVGDFAGRGESDPVRHFYQNLGEAEYVVAVYQYLRLRGYPPDRIAILTTYNGQRALIRDVLERRCAWLPYFGRPAAVSTVDQFQGQQCDVVLLSLVRTRNVGHIRDLRRLTVALSRARLGLYVFGRRALFEPCFELHAPMQRLLANGDRLALCPDEGYGAPVPDCRTATTVRDVEELGAIVYKMIEAHLAHEEATADDPAEDPAEDDPADDPADAESHDGASADAQT